MCIAQKMSNRGKTKPGLPYGWIVKQSTSFPDRVYYFNTQTGASTWNMPDLIKNHHPPVSDVQNTRRNHVSFFNETPVVEAKFSPEVSEEEHDDDSIDLNDDTKDLPSKHEVNNRNPITPTSSYSYSGSSLVKPNFDLSLVKTEKVQHNLSHSKVDDILKRTGGSNQRAGSSVASVRSSSSSVENANRKRSYSSCAVKQGNSSTKKLYDIQSNSSSSTSRFVLSATDNLNSKFSDNNQKQVLKSVPNPPDILAGTGNYSVPEVCLKNNQISTDSKNLLGCIRKIKDSSTMPKLSGSKHQLTDDNQKGDKRKVSYSPKAKGSVQHPGAVTNKKIKTNHTSSTKGKSDAKVFDANIKVTTTLGSDIRKVVSSSEASQCSVNDGDDRDRCPGSTSQVTDIPSKLHLADPDKIKSIQSWIDQCEPEDDLSGISEIFAPSIFANVTSPNYGHGSAADSSLSDCRRVVVAKDRSLDSGLSSADTSNHTFITSGTVSMGNKNNPWKGVHAKPAPVVPRNIMDMEIDEVQTELEANEGRQIEDMDVSEIALKEVREQLQKQSPSEVVGMLTERVSSASEDVQYNKNLNHQKLLVVIDTNVLIENLGFVEELRDEEFKDFDMPVLVIPWVVMQELDALKNSKNNNLSLATSRKARASVTFLFNCFQMKHPRVRGQTPYEAREVLDTFKPECNDDRILHCCIQCRQKNNNPESHVLLLTNDQNLSSKAVILGIKAHSKQTIISGVQQLANPARSNTVKVKSPAKVVPASAYSSPDKVETVDSVADQILCKARLLMKNSLGIVLEKEMKVAYDDLWLQIVLRKPPWTLEDILDCFKKHWMAVFGMIYDRTLKDEVHRLVDKFKPFKGFMPTIEGVEELLNDALKIMNECNNHSNYGIMFRESLEEMKLVQRYLREYKAGTTNETSLSNYLKHKYTPKSKKRLSLDSTANSMASSVAPPNSDMRSPSYLTSPAVASGASSHTSPCVSDAGVSDLQSVEDKFQAIWETILNLCNSMQRWTESLSNEHAQQMNSVLYKLVPYVKDLRFQFEYTLRFSPGQIKSQKANVHTMCIKLNTFFSTMEMEEKGEQLEVEQVQAYFASEERRTVLKAGLRQLDEMIRNIFAFVHLLPD